MIESRLRESFRRSEARLCRNTLCISKSRNKVPAENIRKMPRYSCLVLPIIKKHFGTEQDRAPAFEGQHMPVTHTAGSRSATPRHTRKSA